MGGVARLKVYGEVFKDWNLINEEEIVDLAAAVNGGKAILCMICFSPTWIILLCRVEVLIWEMAGKQNETVR